MESILFSIIVKFLLISCMHSLYMFVQVQRTAKVFTPPALHVHVFYLLLNLLYLAL